MRSGKIKCAAKALACVSACSSFNFAKGQHFFFHFSVRLLSVVSSFRVSANVLRAGARNPVLRLRQGYGACTLLVAALLSAVSLCTVHKY